MAGRSVPNAARGKAHKPHAAAVEEADQAADRDFRARARAFAEPLLTGELSHAGESLLAHADAVADILASIGGSESVQGAAYLAYAAGQLNRPEDVIGSAFGSGFAHLAVAAARLERVQQASRQAREHELSDNERARERTESVRRMLLAFSRDLRVVLLRLASRLQTLRYCAATGQDLPTGLLQEADEVLAPLANRLGIWQIKWQLEDLVFRAKEPDAYRRIARLLDEKRGEREAALERRRAEIEAALRARGIQAQVTGRPKHISSIARKMRGKNLPFDHVFDVRALRVTVPAVAGCYAALDWVHQAYQPVPGEFDDYIAKPKVNGYQSIHTVVRDAQGLAWEVQIRTQAMHEYAERGAAAHWAYKEAGTKGYVGVSAASQYDTKIALVRQLLAWERDLSSTASTHGLFDDHIYVLTPEAAVVELPAGATAVDFAYVVHTELGHRCRGATVDGAMVPLNTPLQNGQTVSVTAVKEGGPSRDWLNPDLGYLASPRAKAKVRAWFNAQQQQTTIAHGRELVEKLLQRKGRTAVALDQLADQLGFAHPEALFETVGKDELSLHSIERALEPAAPSEPAAAPADPLQRKAPDAVRPHSGVLVVGIDSLLTQPARCCRPAPPDEISGYVTRGRGVTVHRSNCPTFRELRAREPERIVAVDWGNAGAEEMPAYPVDVLVQGADRAGLLRDVLDVFAREKMNISGVQTQTLKGSSRTTLTVGVRNTQRLTRILAQVGKVPGVARATRR